MNLKKIKIFSVLGVFLLCFISHFMYDWFPNVLFSIFFPVNESIFEHMKMISTSFLLYSIIEYALIIKYKVNYNNYILNLFICLIISIIIFLIMYLPVFYKIGEKLIITLILLLISIIITEFISYKILSMKKNYTYLNIVSFILIIFLYIIYGYLTYNPIICPFFFDPIEEKYGLNTFLLSYLF